MLSVARRLHGTVHLIGLALQLLQTAREGFCLLTGGITHSYKYTNVT